MKLLLVGRWGEEEVEARVEVVIAETKGGGVRGGG